MSAAVSVLKRAPLKRSLLLKTIILPEAEIFKMEADRKIDTGFETQEIKCDTFLDAEKILERTNAKLKKTRNIKERRYYAGDILLETKTLLSCSNFDTGNPTCLNCHSVSHNLIQEYECLAKDKRRNDPINK